MSHLFSQLFVDTGNGFSEEESVRIPFSGEKNKFVFDLEIFKNIESVRFDPVVGHCILKHLSSNWVYEDGKLKTASYSKSNIDYFRDDHYYFLHDDPSIILDYPSDTKPVGLEVEIEFVGSIEILSNYRQILKMVLDGEPIHKLADVQKILQSINAKVATIEGEFSFQHSLVKKISNNSNILNSVNTSEGKENELNFTKLKLRLANVEEKLALKNDQIKELNKTLKELKSINSELQKAKDELTTRVKSDVIEVEKKFDVLKEIHLKLEKEYKLQNKELKSLIKRHEEQKAKSKVSLKTKADEIRSLKKTSKSLEELNSKLEKELIEFQENQMALETLESEHTKLIDELIFLQKAV